MEMTGEMMDDALEDALDGDGVEEETDEVVSQVRRVWWDPMQAGRCPLGAHCVGSPGT